MSGTLEQPSKAMREAVGKLGEKVDPEATAEAIYRDACRYAEKDLHDTCREFEFDENLCENAEWEFHQICAEAKMRRDETIAEAERKTQVR